MTPNWEKCQNQTTRVEDIPLEINLSVLLEDKVDCFYVNSRDGAVEMEVAETIS